MIDSTLFRHAEPTLLHSFLLLVSEEGSHWLWLGCIGSSGYGKFSIHGQTVGAHRLAFEWANGPLFSWLETDHTCRTPLCVKPSHMEVVTHLENVRRGKLGEALRANPHPLAVFLCQHELSLQEFATRMLTTVTSIRTLLAGHRTGNPEVVYRVGTAMGLSWEEADIIFPRANRRRVETCNTQPVPTHA